MSFYHRLAASFTPHPTAALRCGERRVARDAWPARAARTAGWWRAQGVGPGDRVALQGARDPVFVDLLLGGLAIGAAVIPLNDKYTAPELAGILGDAQPKSAVVADPLAAAVGAIQWSDAVAGLLTAAPDPLANQPAGGDPAVVLYTSGTTGRPKGAVTSHDALWAGVEALHEAWGWTEDDVLFHALPLFHVHGLFVALFGALRAGASCVMVDKFEPVAALDTIARERCTVVMGVPTFYQRFLALPEDRAWDLSHVRLFTSGSAGLPAPTWEGFRARFGHAIVERYGMTEVGIVVSNQLRGDRRPGTIGLPLRGVEARVVDPETLAPRPDGATGELQIRAPSVFSGYLNQPGQTAAMFTPDGWVRTGDLAERATDGWLRLVGRARDLVIVGGFNVHPAEVETALLEHPTVAEAAVVGLPDDDLGERVVASVVGADADEAVLLNFLAGRLAPYKRPRAIRVVDALPRNAMGKVQKEAVRATWAIPAVRGARPAEAAWIAANNVAMALETEGLALDPIVAARGAERVFRGDVGGHYRIAEIGGVPVGQCLITEEWSDWRDAFVWWFQSVYVLPAARRHRVWRALHADVLARARRAGVPVVRLYVDRRNGAAIDTYRRSGMDGDHYLVFEQTPEES